jgi:hypothetical protein
VYAVKPGHNKRKGKRLQILEGTHQVGSKKSHVHAFGKLYRVYIDISRVYHMHLITSECAYALSVVSKMPKQKIRGIKELYPEDPASSVFKRRVARAATWAWQPITRIGNPGFLMQTCHLIEY